MSPRRCYCLYCGDFVYTTEKTQRVTDKVKGIKFEYDETTVYCIHYNEEVYSPSIHDFNIDARYSAYDEAKRNSEENISSNTKVNGGSK